MSSSINEAVSVLGIDVGSVSTRAVLFDVVEESYHFIASGVVPSTHKEPFFDIGEAVYEAISRLQDVTGRMLLDHEDNLITPSQSGGEGVDRLVLTISCGHDLKIVTFGLLSDVSLDSANKLAQSTYGRIVESIGINDRRPPQTLIDAVLAASPDLILFAGGTDRGASRSVARMTQLILQVMNLIPQDARPQLLYCGNSVLTKKIREAVGKLTSVKTSPNIRPTIDNEEINKAEPDLAEMVMLQHKEQIGGLKQISSICSEPAMLSSQAFNRVIQFLGRQYDPAHGVLGIDLGASHTIAAFSNHDKSTVNVFPYGMGKGIGEVMRKTDISEIIKWLPSVISSDQVRDYLWQKTLFPESLPASEEDLSIELAAARHVLRLVMRELLLRNALPSLNFEPILISGSVLNRTVTPQQSLLTILDGIQPLGVSPLILDKHGIVSLLGVGASVNPLLPVQVLESTAFSNLATVVNAVSGAKFGATLLIARLEYSSGSFIDAEVKQGSIVSLPLNPGEVGRLHLKMVRRVEVEDIDLSNEPIKVSGGVCGVVIDARGRPLQIPEDDARRRDLFKRWEFMLGGG